LHTFALSCTINKVVVLGLQEVMDQYVLMLLLSADQELAIQQLFMQQNWPFNKIGIYI